jgi:hypothetical protein
LLCFVATPAFASNTTGYAWSESLGWFDFTNVTISDTQVTGNAYNDNTGWLVLNGITNTNGTLSGYAWSESVGYFDFSDVAITNGAFSGYAYNDNTGWLSFETGTNVTTTWAPAVAQTTGYRPAHRRVLPVTSSIPNTPLPTTPSQPRNLTLGSQGNDVKTLQVILNLMGYTISTEGPGSLNNESTYFGEKTKQALIKFQKENNITPPEGYFGPKTRDMIIIKLISLLLTSN